MMASRLDITAIFCPKGYRFAYDVDDFCIQWSKLWQQQQTSTLNAQRKDLSKDGNRSHPPPKAISKRTLRGR